MDNKNNVIIVLLVVLIGIFSGVGMLFGISNAVGVAVSPMNARLTEIALELKYNKSGNIDKRLVNIEQQLSRIESKINAMGQNGPRYPQPQQPPAEDMNKIYNIPVGISAVLGNPNAPVTITEFSDFQCPFCAHFYSAVKDVLAAYPGRVRVVIKNFPLSFHPNARPAAKLAMAANEQGKFQPMMEMLLANGGDVSDSKIKEYAQKLGLNYDKLMADYKNQDSRWENQIQNDMQLGAQVDVRGTPTFYLNGRKTNARDLSSFKAEIDPLLAGKK